MITGYIPIHAGPFSTAFNLPGLSASPTTVKISNLGPSAASVALGTSTGLSASLADTGVLPGTSVELPRGSNAYIAAIAGPQGCSAMPVIAELATLVVTTEE